MEIVEDIYSGLTVQKDLGSRDSIIVMIEGFRDSTTLGGCYLVFFYQLLESIGIGMWLGGVDPCGVIGIYYDVEEKSIIEPTNIGFVTYAFP